MWSYSTIKSNDFMNFDKRGKGVWAEIVETTFVVSHFSDIRKEMTSFLVVPKKPDQERRLFSVGSEKYMTRNNQKRTN